MKEKKTGKILVITLLSAVGAFLIYDVLQLRKQYMKTRDEMDAKAGRRVITKHKTRENLVNTTLSNNIQKFEAAMAEHGAVLREDLDEKNVGKYELRPIYEYKGNYYRVGSLVFETEDDPYIVINAIDSERFAKIGVMEEIEAYPYDIPAERIREVVAEFLETEL